MQKNKVQVKTFRGGLNHMPQTEIAVNEFLNNLKKEEVVSVTPFMSKYSFAIVVVYMSEDEIKTFDIEATPAFKTAKIFDLEKWNKTPLLNKLEAFETDMDSYTNHVIAKTLIDAQNKPLIDSRFSVILQTMRTKIAHYIRSNVNRMGNGMAVGDMSHEAIKRVVDSYDKFHLIVELDATRSLVHKARLMLINDSGNVLTVAERLCYIQKCNNVAINSHSEDVIKKLVKECTRILGYTAKGINTIIEYVPLLNNLIEAYNLPHKPFKNARLYPVKANLGEYLKKDELADYTTKAINIILAKYEEDFGGTLSYQNNEEAINRVNMFLLKRELEQTSNFKEMRDKLYEYSAEELKLISNTLTNEINTGTIGCMHAHKIIEELNVHSHILN